MITRLPPGTFFGDTSRRVSCGGLTFTETVYSGAMVIPAHEHPGGYLSFTAQGSLGMGQCGWIRSSAAAALD
jgi:AraC family transcriptional regulator